LHFSRAHGDELERAVRADERVVPLVPVPENARIARSRFHALGHGRAHPIVAVAVVGIERDSRVLVFDLVQEVGDLA